MPALKYDGEAGTEPLAPVQRTISKDVTFSFFAYDINKKGVSLQAKYGWKMSDV